MEAQFGLEDKSALGLYGCLVPHLKNHRNALIPRAFRVNYDEDPLVEENFYLQGQVRLLNNKLSILNWYLEVMEEGIDMKEIAQKYSELKK